MFTELLRSDPKADQRPKIGDGFKEDFWFQIIQDDLWDINATHKFTPPLFLVLLLLSLGFLGSASLQHFY